MSEVNLILPQNTPKTIKGPLAGDKPIYIYLSPKNDFLLYSENLKKLLSHHKVKTPLEVSDEGISFLLQSGFIPTPKTAFKNLFVLTLLNTFHVLKPNHILTKKEQNLFLFQNLQVNPLQKKILKK